MSKVFIDQKKVESDRQSFFLNLETMRQKRPYRFDFTLEPRTIKNIFLEKALTGLDHFGSAEIANF